MAATIFKALMKGFTMRFTPYEYQPKTTCGCTIPPPTPIQCNAHPTASSKRKAPSEGWDYDEASYAVPCKRLKVVTEEDNRTLASLQIVYLEKRLLETEQKADMADEARAQMEQKLLVASEQASTAAQQELARLRAEDETRLAKAEQKCLDQIALAQENVSQLKCSLEAKDEDLQQAQRGLQDWKDKIEPAEARYAEAISRAEEAEKKEKEATRKWRDLRTAYENVRPDVDMDEASQQHLSLAGNTAQLSVDLNSARRQIDDKEMEIQALAARVKLLEEQLSNQGAIIASRSPPVTPPQEAQPYNGGITLASLKTPKPLIGPNAVAKAPVVAAPSRWTRATDKTSILTDFVKFGHGGEFFTESKPRKEPHDPFPNEFCGEGFDPDEAREISAYFDWDNDCFLQNDVNDGTVLFGKDGFIVYYAVREPHCGPLLILFTQKGFDLEKQNEKDELILPLSKNLRANRGDDIKQFAQACIIAQLPEVQVEAARHFLSTKEIQQFEHRSFKEYKHGKPAEKCQEELRFPKMFKKVTKYLRNDWKFRRAAKAWAAGAATSSEEFSCWPPSFKKAEHRDMRTFESEDQMDEIMDIVKGYKSNCKKDDDSLSKLSDRFNIEDPDPKKAITVNGVMDRTGSVDLSKGKQTSLPSEKAMDGLRPQSAKTTTFSKPTNKGGVKKREPKHKSARVGKKGLDAAFGLSK